MTETPPARPTSTSFLDLLEPRLLADPIVQSLIAILAVSAFFVVFPGLDVWFSRLFYAAGQSFPASQLPGFVGLRDIGRWLTRLIPTALVIVVVARIAWPEKRSAVPLRDVIFLLSTLAIGSGIIVNLIFKLNWGRPRPTMVTLFGGNQPFVGVWRITDYCHGSCSFVSGEGSTAFWLLATAIVFAPRWRPFADRLLLVLAVLISFDRIAMGGHFLSDVLLSWAITALVLAIGHRLIIERPPLWLTEEALQARATEAGRALRRLASRERGETSGR